MVGALVGALVVATLPGCGDDGAGDDAAPAAGGVEGTVLVLAAASLTDAFGELADAFEAANPGVTVELSFAGSSALATQIQEGAPADVFASADTSNLAEVVESGDVTAEPEVLVRNELQIVVPAGNPGGVQGLDDLARDELLVGLCAPAVPCGALAREALANAGVEAAPDTDEPDVRALLTKVEAGELDAGIVYRTDVSSAGDAVEGVEIPAEVNVVAEYLIAPLARAPNATGADAFVGFARSDEGRAILESHGFRSP